MDNGRLEELTPENIDSLFYQLIREFKKNLTLEMSNFKESSNAAVPVMLTVWGLGGYFSEGGRSDVVEIDGEMLSLSRYLLSAIENGTNPEGRGYWSSAAGRGARFTPEFAAGIAFAAFVSRSYLLRKMSNRSVQLLEQWLESEAKVSVKKRHFSSLAAALNHAARKGMGLRYDEKVIETAFETLERCYIEGGWFSGSGAGPGHYDDSVSWGYLSLLSALLYTEGGKRSPRYKVWGPRIRKALRDFPYLYDPKGDTPRYGDSSAGIVARLAGPAAAYIIGAWPGKPGVLKRMLRLNINRALEDDLKEKHIDGNRYRAMQTLCFLFMIPLTDAFWQIDEEPLPIERGDFVHFASSPGWLIHGAGKDGHIQLINGGAQREKRQKRRDLIPRYGKFCYSGSLGFVADFNTDSVGFCCDNVLSAGRDNKGWSHRDKIDSFRLVGDRVLFTSAHIPVGADGGITGRLKVDTLIIPLRSGAQIRVHRVRNTGFPSKNVQLREGGYALGIEPGEDIVTSANGHIARAEGKLGFSLLKILGGYGFAAISNGYEGRSEGHTKASGFLLPRVEAVLHSGETNYFAVYLHGGTNLDTLDTGETITFLRKGDHVSLLSRNKAFFEFDFQS